jgi:DNA replication protein DnaC
MTQNDRTGRPQTLDAAIANVEATVDFETLGHSLEWWEQRDREVKAEIEQATAEAERSRMLSRSSELRDNGFPEMFVTAALGELAETPAILRARAFIQLVERMPRKRLLLLAGGVGAGKTTAATFVLLKGQDPRPGFMRINELERRGRYDKKLDEWLKDKTSLVIDDVGAESLDGKGVFRSLLDEIVDMFYGNRRTLVMTTNLRPVREATDKEDQFRERYGERIWSRLGQVAMWGDCGTRDLRREASR